MTGWRDAPEVDISPLSDLDLHPIIARALIRRGLKDPGDARAFLNAAAAGLAAPSQLPGVAGAVDRIQAAIARHETICIWGDFDVDGQTSTALLVQALTTLGAPPTYHVPVRAREGHGVHADTLATILDSGVKLIVTCDTGITAHAAVEQARKQGVDFVITDHHELGATLPDACAVVDPRLLLPGHPLANLAGVGVAYEVAAALMEAHGMDPAPLLDLVALGLIADVALLRGDTRALAQRGIAALRTTSRLGLRAIAELARIDLPTLTEETIGFELAPRLNAVGRLGDANQAVECLLTADPVRANVLASQIEGLNIRRRLLTEQVHQAAEEMLRADPSLQRGSILILANPGWPGGVLGIVASQLVGKYQKPALLLSGAEDGSLHGSARSIEGVDITRAIAEGASDLLAFGGHPMAAGMSLRADKLESFSSRLGKSVSRMLAEAQLPEPALTIDEWLTLDQVNLEVANALEALAPFGAGNPSLVLATANVTLASSRQIGRSGKHRRLAVTDQKGFTGEVLWWNAAEDELPEGPFDLAYALRATTYAGQRQLTMEFRDARPVVQPSVVVAPPKLQVIDLRLQGSAARLPPACLLWVEGTAVTPGTDRMHLHESSDLAVWTTPPSRSELKMALAQVKPRTVYLIGVAPASSTVEDYLKRLAGMAKFALTRRGGRIDVTELAAATASRELTVRLGLEWLAAGGHVRIQETEEGLQLARGDSRADKQGQSELLAGVRSLLDETAAYRSYFGRATPERLLEF